MEQSIPVNKCGSVMPPSLLYRPIVLQSEPCRLDDLYNGMDMLQQEPQPGG